ncbi:MAG TPA: polynucleotide adenylyltransferase [Verrucomicrobiota bacterium]|nr:polynucleotide adenylyltransferase [Verrucomicrobiota bacterium]
MNELLPSPLANLLEGTPELAESYLVGGCVRDWLLGTPIKDFDVEVFGLDYESLVNVLRRWGRADLVGRSFGVVKLTVASGETYDFALARRDSKVAPGHKGFAVEFDPNLTPREAAARRDFTINSLMWNPRRRELLDFFGGEADLRQKRLRHTSAAFSEDPLRVLRGMQFASRFSLTVEPETLALCQSIQSRFAELAVERVRDEWFKWAAQATVPSAGLRFLRDSGWLIHFPEIAALVGVPQDPQWHPEGDVWIHTLHCLDALVELGDWRAASTETRIVLSLATLAHDFAKPACTRTELREGRERTISPGHEAAGGPVAESFLHRVGTPAQYVGRIVPLVKHHLAHLQDPTPRAVRRLAHRLAPATITELMIVMTADASGRPPLPRGEPPGVLRLREAADQLALAETAPRPMLLGRHLVERGLLPGPEFGRLLAAAFEAQLDGQFLNLEDAKKWLDRELLSKDTPILSAPTAPERGLESETRG